MYLFFDFPLEERNNMTKVMNKFLDSMSPEVFYQCISDKFKSYVKQNNFVVTDKNVSAQFNMFKKEFEGSYDWNICKIKDWINHIEYQILCVCILSLLILIMCLVYGCMWPRHEEKFIK